MQSIHSSPRRTPAAPAAVPGGWIDLTREGFCYAQNFGILSFSVVAQSLVNWPYGISRLLESQELLHVVYEIYNTWAAELCKTNPARLVALACIPNDDPALAAAELRRSATLGLKGADFAVSTAVKPIWHRDWDPLWAA